MKLITTLTLLLLLHSGFGQSYTDRKEFTIDTKNLKAFHLYNKTGNVKVKGIEGQVATMQVTRKLRTSSSKRLEEAKSEIRLDSIVEDNTVYFFVKSNDLTFRIDEDGYGSYNSCCNSSWRDGDREVNHEFTIELEIPKTMELVISTHRKDLEIENFDGKLSARTHHNNLTAKNLGGVVQLSSHHGNIDASFTKNPSADCSYKTHHGDIRITYQSGLSSVAYFKSRHGSFFSDFDWSPETIPVVKTSLKNGTKYKMSNSTAVKIGSGGLEQSFQTWHGDIYLLRSKN
ncbi:MAG: DUF4097 family beta strand repeat-containing protein [Cyclobacteriaceae bacterium]